MNKKWLVFFVSILFVSHVFAQDFCGMNLSDEEALKVFQYREKLASLKPNTRTSDYGQLVTIPIKFHVFGNDQGENRYNLESLLIQLHELNQAYEQVGFYFHMIPEINIVDDDRYIGSGDDANSGSYSTLLARMMNRFHHHGALNIYYTSNLGNLCGMAPFPNWNTDIYGSKTGVLMHNTCGKPGEMTLAHELGHHFDLLHTFQGWDSGSASFSEYVTRVDSIKNCNYAGDGFCDTPADVLDYSCPYVGDYKDLRGHYYSPDVSLIMSYHADRCQNKFSDEQIAHMRDVLFTDTSRTVYLNNPVDDFSVANSTTLLSPTTNSTAYTGEPTLFEWEEVVDADAYVFSVLSRSAGELRPRYQAVVTSNFYELELPEEFVGIPLQWRVVPFKWTQPQSTPSSTHRLTVKIPEPTGIFDNKSVTVNSYPNPAHAGQQLTVFLNSHHEISEPIQSKVIALNGQILQEVTIQSPQRELNIPLDGDIPSGVYLLQLSTAKEVYTSKVVIQ